jgi:lipoteichoic acid synthase
METESTRRNSVVVPAEAIEPRHPVRAVCLFLVLVISKTLTLAGRDLPLSPLAPFVFFWQDVLAALVFLAVDRFLQRLAFARLLYGVAVAYVAINVPVAVVLGTPLTWTMMRAAGGPLADSIGHYFTPFNVGSLVLVAVAGALLPMVLARRRVNPSWSVVAAAMVFVTIGAAADSRIETRGLQRNAFGALVGSSMTRIGKSANTTADSGIDARTNGRATEALSKKAPGAFSDLEYLRGAARGRNVVLIVLESTAARYLGLYGAARDPMPNLRQLGRQALVFDAAYAVYPESIKGLFSTICSRYPAIDTPTADHARVPCISLARILAQSGYRTALFHSGRFEYLGMAPMIADRGFEVLKDAGDIGGNVRSSFGVDEPSTVREMLEWIDGLEKGEQFFLMYLPVAGHHPYAAPGPGPFDLTGDFGRYLNSLHYGDAALGELFSGLRTRKLDDRTLIVVQGDHGEAFGQHSDNFAHSLFIYDENIRVPYLVAAPGLITDHIRSTGVSSVIDTTPTILDLLGYAAPVQHQGRSLLRSETRPAFFYTDYSLGWLGLRDSCWKYLYERDSDRSKLYDVCSDPDEVRNLSGDFEARAHEYRVRVQRWASAQRDAVAHGR